MSQEAFNQDGGPVDDPLEEQQAAGNTRLPFSELQNSSQPDMGLQDQPLGSYKSVQDQQSRLHMQQAQQQQGSSQHQQQHQHQHQQLPKQQPGPPEPDGWEEDDMPGWDPLDELEEYLQEQEVMGCPPQQHQQPYVGEACEVEEGETHKDTHIDTASRQPAPASSRCAGGIPPQAAWAPPSAAAAATTHGGGGGGGVQGMLDLAAELEDLLQEEEEPDSSAAGAGAPVQEAPAAQQQPPQQQPAKPATLAHLTHATSRGAVAAAARAAVTAAAAEQPPHLLAHEVEGGGVLPVTAADGRRVYCSLASARDTWRGSRRGGQLHGGSGGLLGRPITELLAAVEAARQQELRESVAALSSAAAALEAMERDEDEPGAPLAAAAAGSSGGQQPPQQQLWVDKYAPARFTCLLSDERVNRAVARWFKGHHPHHRAEVLAAAAAAAAAAASRQAAAEAAAAERRSGGDGGGRGEGWGRDSGGQGRGGGRGGGPGGQGRGRGGSWGRGGSSSGWGRGRGGPDWYQLASPTAPLLLLAGAPGIGKTTLAHVLARHAGFRPVEINASDERTAPALTRRLLDAAEMRPLLDAEQRPNAIIIDEVDGATGGSEGHSAVAALVKLLTGAGPGGGGRAGRRKKGAKGAAGAGSTAVDGARGGNGGGGAVPVLTCPVVAIANDLYAPALRPLRDIAAVVHFKPPAADALVMRLGAICCAEGLAADKQALVLLAQRTGCDVRACINTLQLLARQHAAKPAPGSGGSSRCTISRATVSGLALGQKDFTLNGMSLLQQLLAPSNGRGSLTARLKVAAATSGGEGSSGCGARVAAAQAAELYNSLLDFNDHDLMMSGILENLCELALLDVDLRSTAAAAEALSAADLLMAGGSSASAGRLGAYRHYVPSCLLSVRRLAEQQRSAGLQLQWPRAQLEARRRQVAADALLRSWASSPKLAPGVGRCLACRGVLLDLVPAVKQLLDMRCVRPLVPRLLRVDEMAALQRQVSFMVGYGLDYCFEDTPAPGDPAAAGAAAARRPAPARPAVDTLHVFGAGEGGSSGPGVVPGGAGEMPLMLRQVVAREVMAERARRAEQARQLAASSDAAAGPTPSPAGAAAAAAAAAKAKQAFDRPSAGVTRAGGGAGSNKRLAASSAGVPAPAAKKARGCWLDQLKAAAASKRRANLGAAVGAAKKAKVAAAAAAVMEGGCDTADQESGGAGAGADRKDTADKEACETGAARHLVLYQYNEGYTNAVKRPIRMAELL